MKKTLLFCLLGAAVLLAACRKDFLGPKPSKALLVPETAADLRALLDNNFVFNSVPGLSALSDGDLFVTPAAWNGFFSQQERNAYTWSEDLFAGEPEAEWSAPYQQVFYANVVLETLAKLPLPADSAGAAELRGLKGEALFHRAFAFFNLVQLFAKPYNAASAATDPGIPLRLSSDVTQKTGRSTLAESYRQVIADCRAARSLLPLSSAYKSRPAVPAAFALLARVCLNMQDYKLAGAYADSCLQLRPALIDYNTLNAAAARPFPRALPDGNDEVIFYATLQSFTYGTSSSASFADTVLYDAYEANDLRKTVFFRAVLPGRYKFKGNYAGIITLFGGLATDELYLIRAECAARQGMTSRAMDNLNRLLVNRWKAGTFVPLAAADAERALAVVLAERRKELTGRGLRWADLRRLNQDPRFAVTLRRQLEERVYELAPGSRRYTFPIPVAEIRLNPMPQNER